MYNLIRFNEIYTLTREVKGESMKKCLLALVGLLFVAVLIGGCSSESVMDALIREPEREAASEPTESAEETEETQTVEVATASVGEGLVGTWINEDYNGEGRSAKVVYTQKADGTIVYISYDNSDGSGNTYEGTVDVKEMKEDSQGRTVGRSVVTLAESMSWDTLFRISADGSTLEVQSGTENIDPKGPQYSIYYRQ
jgi:major membrane immunogen (membrane-anchored lipoprotein)